MLEFLPKGEIILESDSSHRSSQTGKLNEPLTSFICSVFDATKADSGNTDLSLLNQLPLSWAKSPNNIGKIYSTPLIKIRIDHSKPLPEVINTL